MLARRIGVHCDNCEYRVHAFLGLDYKLTLRNRVKEHLNKTIQAGGGSTGHSSVEDSIATLDLVRWHILNGPKPKPKVVPSKPTPASAPTAPETSSTKLEALSSTVTEPAATTTTHQPLFLDDGW